MFYTRRDETCDTRAANDKCLQKKQQLLDLNCRVLPDVLHCVPPLPKADLSHCHVGWVEEVFRWFCVTLSDRATLSD